MNKNFRELFGKGESLAERLKREGLSRTVEEQLRELAEKLPKQTVTMNDLPTLNYEEILRRNRG
jgi:2-phospho-L-lactate guanylyltransferase (CobY/MobA/RfbA family)